MSRWCFFTFSLFLFVPANERSPVDALSDDGCGHQQPLGYALLQQSRTTHKRMVIDSVDAEQDLNLVSKSSELVLDSIRDQRPYFSIRGQSRHRPRGTSVSKKMHASDEYGELLTANATACRTSVQVTAHSSINMICDESCPFWAEEVVYGRYCSFQCVGATECASLNPSTGVADTDWSYCKSCMIQGCAECMADGTSRCSNCEVGYNLEGGTCLSKFSSMIYFRNALLIVSAVAFIFGVVWLFDLAFRPVTNPHVLAEALAARSRSKLHNSKSVPRGRANEMRKSSRLLWPLNTNLLSTPVAGSGYVLHFRFQAAIILWATCVAAAWAIIAFYFDDELFVLGRRPAFTPLERCVVIKWGWEKQQKLIPLKMCFVFFVYFGSVVFLFIFAVCQARQCHALNSGVPSMADFVLECTGLPRLQGSEDVEYDLQQAIQAATGQTLIGVSMCWDFQSNADFVEEALKRDLEESEENWNCSTKDEGTMRLEKQLSGRDSVLSRLTGWGLFHYIEKMLIPIILDSTSTRALTSPVRSLLCGLQSSDRAFAVFSTTEARNRALRSATEKHGVRFRTDVVHLKAVHKEPDSILWCNYTCTSKYSKGIRLGIGILCIIIALALWTLLFYLPFNYFVLSYTYASSEESPSILAFTAFSSAIVLGNSFLYSICSEAAYRVGFHYNDDREMAYTVMYTFACAFNVLLDLLSAYFVLFKVMADLGVRTHDGVPLGDVTSFQSRFGAYGMQRALGENLLTYAFPSTFLAPFLIEPLFACYLPLRITKLLVGTHREISYSDAETFLACRPLDLSRYPDICVDVVIAVLIFFFPGGYVLEMFCALAGSHLFVFFWDTYKLLRLSQSGAFVGCTADFCCQAILAFPCAILLSCATWMLLDNQSTQQLNACVGVFVAHVLLHWLVLYLIYHAYVDKNNVEVQNTSYAEVALRVPCNWFSANPVHCLRSKYFHEHDPPCHVFYPGKEHLQQPNPKIGMFFNDPAASVEQ